MYACKLSLGLLAATYTAHRHCHTALVSSSLTFPASESDFCKISFYFDSLDGRIYCKGLSIPAYDLLLFWTNLALLLGQYLEMSQTSAEFQPCADVVAVDPKDFSFLASTMADKEDATILRRFDELNILNVLVLQNEIQGLSGLLKRSFRPKKDDPGGIPLGYLASYVINYAPETTGEPQLREEEVITNTADQWKLLQVKLKEYSVLIPSFSK